MLNACHNATRAALTFCALAITAPVLSQTTAERVRIIERSVSVVAEGRVSATPDRAAITTGVRTEAATAQDAMNANSAIMSKLIEGLKAMGIPARDIQTTSLQINPRYSTSVSNRSPEINGYMAVNQIRIVVNDLKRFGEVLDQAIALGANQMGGIQFEVSKAEALRDEARRDAMANARRRADLLAAAAGASLGEVLTISETTRTAPPPQLYSAGRAAMASEVPVASGAIDLAATVNVTWALK